MRSTRTWHHLLSNMTILKAKNALSNMKSVVAPWKKQKHRGSTWAGELAWGSWVVCICGFSKCARKIQHRLGSVPGKDKKHSIRQSEIFLQQHDVIWLGKQNKYLRQIGYFQVPSFAIFNGAEVVFKHWWICDHLWSADELQSERAKWKQLLCFKCILRLIKECTWNKQSPALHHH